MSITTELNEAKADLDVALDELRLLTSLLATVRLPQCDEERIWQCVDTALAKTRRVRASL